MPIEAADREKIDGLRRNIEKVIFGKPDVVRFIVTALLARGHVLIEDIPGIGKTSLARALARSISCSFKRIQFTPDLLPSDVTGISVFDPEKRDFAFKAGPIFANIVLADEINRTTPRTQSALLEAMNENRVTLDGTTRALPDPFMVIATQNPIEFTGTYLLPESQLDRFLMTLRIGYPDRREEQDILRSRLQRDPIDDLQPAVAAEEVVRLSSLAGEVRTDSSVTGYVLDIVERSRNERSLIAGVSPRGAIHLSRAARAHALVSGRDYVTPDDVKAVAPCVLSHRIIEKRVRPGMDGREAAGQIIQKILREVSVPQ